MAATFAAAATVTVGLLLALLCTVDALPFYLKCINTHPKLFVNMTIDGSTYDIQLASATPLSGIASTACTNCPSANKLPGNYTSEANGAAFASMNGSVSFESGVCTVNDISLPIIVNDTNHLISCNESSGVLGLAPVPNGTFFDTLRDSCSLGNYVALHGCPYPLPNPGKPQGTLYFGTVPSSHLVSPVSFVPLVHPANETSATEYLVAVTGLFANGVPIPTTDPTAPLTAVVDIGSSYLVAENEFDQYALFFSAIKLLNLSYFDIYPSFNPFTWTGTPEHYFCNQTKSYFHEFWEGFFKGTQSSEGSVPAGGQLTIQLNNSTNLTMDVNNLFSENGGMITNRGFAICGAFCNLPKVRECTRSVIGLPALWGNVLVLGQGGDSLGVALGNNSMCQGEFEPITTTTTTTTTSTTSTTTTKTTTTTTRHNSTTTTTTTTHHSNVTTTTTTTTTTHHNNVTTTAATTTTQKAAPQEDKYASTWSMKQTLTVVFSCIGGVLVLAGVLMFCAKPRKSAASYNTNSNFQTPYAAMDDDDEY